MSSRNLRRKILSYSAFLLLTGLFSCSLAPDQFGRLNLKKWRSDWGGCKGIRATLVPDFRAEVQNLKSINANSISDMLGRPDATILTDRNQKFYVYYLEQGPHCARAGKAVRSNSRSVAIRISAIGLATEITFQNGLP